MSKSYVRTSGSADKAALDVSTTVHAFEIFDVRLWIANEHLAIWRLDRGQRLGVEHPVGGLIFVIPLMLLYSVIGYRVFKSKVGSTTAH